VSRVSTCKWGVNMFRKYFAIGVILLSGFSAGQVISQSAKNGDETLDLAEVKAAASAKFDKLNEDADGTLDAKEVGGIIGAKTFKAADTDSDGTLTKDEYLALVEKLFKKADVDHDGTLSVQELKSEAAQTLRHLIE
jgi:EF hand